MEKIRCPKCGSTNTAPLLFTFPRTGIDYSKYILTDDVCYGDESDPNYGCHDCGHWWWKDTPYKGNDSIPEFLQDYIARTD